MDIPTFIIYASVYIGLLATSFYTLSYISGKKMKKPLFSDDELPSVTVLIPAYNEEKSMKRTLESIYSSDYPKDKFEVIVINNNSKDKTVQIAKELKQKYKELKIYNETKQGKGCALNLGIKKSKGEIIFSMDADSFVEPRCVKEMVRYFKNPKVMSVTPSMLIHKPKGILQRVQQAEYLFGLFLRKSFSTINAVHITPGAFSAYRRTFFEKHGDYDEENITEDLEMSLKIQYHHYIVENSADSPVYTIAPNKFKALMVQRRRWYAGLMRNTWRYKKIIGPKYGDLGMFVIPIVWISIFFSIFAISYLSLKILNDVTNQLVFLSKINFDFSNSFQINKYVLERFFFNFFTNQIVIFLLFFILILWIYLKFAEKNVGKTTELYRAIPLYFILFSLFFGFWWTISIIYVILNKKVKWR